MSDCIRGSGYIRVSGYNKGYSVGLLESVTALEGVGKLKKEYFCSIYILQVLTCHIMKKYDKGEI